MKKLIVGLAAIAGIIALRSVAGRGGQKIREHCMQMAGRCKQMMAGQAEEHSQTPEHCKEMMAARQGHEQSNDTREHPEQKARSAPAASLCS